MRDVATEAKVSPMTVSRVLHEDPNVAETTRSRVMEAVEKLNYRRNETARNLRLGREAGLVGIVVANLANPYYSEFALGVESVIGNTNRRLMIANSSSSEDKEEDLVDDFVSRRVDGLIITPAGRDQSNLQRLIENAIPLVLAGTPPTGIDADCVLVDDFGGALRSTRRLIEKGHRQIGFIGNPPSLYTDAERFRGFSAAMEEAGIKFSSRHERRFHSDVAGYQQAAKELLEGSRPPSAIFCANNRITLGTLRAVSQSKSEVEIVCFDDFEIADLVGIPIILVSFDADLLGKRAAELLLEQITGTSTLGTRRIVIPTVLVERET
jgi:LacI family transcriptional regulator